MVEHKDMAKADNATRDDVRKEMAKPRISKSARIAELEMDASRTPAAPSAAMPGIVDKTIPPRRSQPERPGIPLKRPITGIKLSALKMHYSAKTAKMSGSRRVLPLRFP